MDKIIGDEVSKVPLDEKSSSSTSGSSDDEMSQSSVGMAAVGSSMGKVEQQQLLDAKGTSSKSWSLYAFLFYIFVQPFVHVLNALCGMTTSPTIKADSEAQDDLFEAALIHEKKKEETRIAAERKVEEDRVLQAKAKEAKRIAREKKRAEEARLLLELIEEERRQQVEKIYQEMMKMRDDKREKKRGDKRAASKRSKSMVLQTSDSIAEEKPKSRRVYFRENGRVRSYIVAKDI